mmetsp:Transcript_13414/g.31360  ORF Transcript_13414/g.31360 Transcript_13414/m.31360 type:complete len:420 (-) Transcript_13414:217-1476(-)
MYFSRSPIFFAAMLLLPVATTARSKERREESSPATRLLRGRELESTSDIPERKPRIIGGEEAEVNRFPYYALMNGNNLCGAVLISPRFAVTAAHCQDADLDFSVNPLTRRTFNETGIVDRAVHPLYDDFTYANDVAIFELAEDALNPDGTPAALVRLNPDPVEIEGTSMTVIGFGDIDPDEEVTRFANALHRVDVNYITNDSCNRDHRGEIDDNMMCAKDDGKDACYGDSGGPLLLTPNEGDYTQDSLVGIVSWGRGCANERFPGVYTRISEFYDWITGTTCVLNAKKAPPYVDCDAILGVDVSELLGDDDEVGFREEPIIEQDPVPLPLPVTDAPVPSPTLALVPPPPPPMPVTLACGIRGESCTTASDCCSFRCNLFANTCYPPTTTGRDRISSGMGGSGGGSSILRDKAIARGGFN